MEAADLMRISRSTLTFTITYRAVLSLVESSEHSAALLGVGVCAGIFISKSVAHFAALENKKATHHFYSLASHVANLLAEVLTQFVSNLVAILLGKAFSEALSLWWVVLFAVFGICLVWYVTEDLKTTQ